MQSSLTVLCRALVMLICLIAIPAAALFGTALPELAGGLLKARWGARPILRRDAQSEATLPEAAEAGDPFDRASGGSMFADHPPTESSAGWPASSSEPASPPLPARSPGFPRTHPPTDTIRASYQSPAPGRVSPSGGAAMEGSAAWQERMGDNSRSGEPDIARSASRPTGGPPPSASPDDWFTYIQLRLRELGATYYLLESWGERDEYFRFQCRMAVDGSGGCVRHFEATDANALEAMMRVLRDVETWKGAGR